MEKGEILAKYRIFCGRVKNAITAKGFVRIVCIMSMNGITGVAGGRFDDGVALLEEALLLGVLHHAQPDSVLDAPARVEKLAFRHCRGRRKELYIFEKR